MSKRKVITPAMRAQQMVLRLQALRLSEGYKAKIARERTTAIRKAIKEMSKYPYSEVSIPHWFDFRQLFLYPPGNHIVEFQFHIGSISGRSTTLKK